MGDEFEEPNEMGAGAGGAGAGTELEAVEDVGTDS